MSDKTSRPRRAWHHEDDLQESLIPEEAIEEPSTGPRRGSADDAFDAGLEPAGEPLNPFARPGSSESEAAPPPEQAPMIPAPVFPRSAGEFSESPSPAPRRSALSSNTPVEASTEAPPPVEPRPSWVSAHRAALIRWGLGGIVGALIVGVAAFLITRGIGPAEPTDSPSPLASDSVSVAPPEPAEEADLVTGEDLAAVATPAEWSVIGTTSSAAEHDLRPLCLSTLQEPHNPTHSFQRTLGTGGDDKLAALHRIDVFASEAAAQEMMELRTSALANCTEVAARMVGAATVTGLSTDTFQVTLVQEDDPAKYHTVLVVRDGAALQLLDVARDGSPPEADALAGVLVRPTTRIAEVQGVEGPGTPAVVNAVVPPADPPGWLTPVDLPRLNPGVGRWTMTEQQPIDTRGMGCEDMELATEAGPTERAKIAYALTQDPQVPERFGIDELLFTFPSPVEAAAFVTKLGTNLNSCKDRVNTAEVEELDGVAPRDAEGNTLSARIFAASQAISDTERVHYQSVVAVAGNKVAYTLVSVTPEVQFTPEQLTYLAERVAIRASQLPA